MATGGKRELASTTPGPTLPAPWARLVGGAPDVVWSYRFDLSVPPAEAWEILVDTSELNSALGLARFESIERGGVAHAVHRHLGIVYEWDEPPWSWVDQRHVQALRIYTRGPARFATIRYAIEPRSSGCTALVDLAFWTRNLVAKAVLRFAGITFRVRYARGLAAMQEARAGQRVAISSQTTADPGALAAAAAKAIESGAPRTAVSALASAIGSAPDRDVLRMRPRVLARQVALPERDAVLACLHATRAGLLDLVWDVVCPHCRGARRTVRHLGEIPPQARCEPCGLDFSTARERAIEVTFRPSPRVRDVRERWHCVAEAATQRHVRAQEPLGAGDVCVSVAPSAPGTYRVRVRGQAGARSLVVRDGAPPRTRIALSSIGERAVDEGGAERTVAGGDAEWTVAPGGEIELAADRGQDEVVVIEDPSWPDEALGPAMLFNLQDFRDLFAAEYVPADVQLAVGVQVILFTDLVGSTKMYAARGDARAFAAVKQHFALSYEVIKRHDGAVVKTIGDAVMAAFARPEEALAAAIELIRELDASDLDLEMRVSLYSGTCIAVQLNSGIDYFGQTVNIAAKLQGCVGARQIVLPAPLADLPAVAELCEGSGIASERFVHEVPAITERFEVCRLTIASQ